MTEFQYRVPRQSSLGRALVFWTAVQPDGKRPNEREDRNGERNARLEAAAWNAFVKAASDLGVDPVELAETWQDRLASVLKTPLQSPIIEL